MQSNHIIPMPALKLSSAPLPARLVHVIAIALLLRTVPDAVIVPMFCLGRSMLHAHTHTDADNVDVV